MFWVLVTLALLLAIVLIVMVLLQPSKGGGLGGAFGGLGTSLGSTFGSRRTLDFLAKGTTYVAVAIALICIFANKFFIPSGGEQGRVPVTTGAPTPGGTPSVTLPTLPEGTENAAPQEGGAAGTEAPAETPAPAEGE